MQSLARGLAKLSCVRCICVCVGAKKGWGEVESRVLRVRKFVLGC